MSPSDLPQTFLEFLFMGIEPRVLSCKGWSRNCLRGSFFSGFPPNSFQGDVSPRKLQLCARKREASVGHEDQVWRPKVRQHNTNWLAPVYTLSSSLYCRAERISNGSPQRGATQNRSESRTINNLPHRQWEMVSWFPTTPETLHMQSGTRSAAGGLVGESC